MSPAAGTPSTDPALPASLARRFEAIVLDWDGTAVPDRKADATGCAAASNRPAQPGSSWLS